MISIDMEERVSIAQKSLSDAMSFQASGDFESAEKAYVRVLHKDYRTIDILPLLASVVAKRGDAETALYYWNKLLGLNPGHLVALMEKVRCCVSSAGRRKRSAAMRWHVACHPKILSCVTTSLSHWPILAGSRRRWPNSVMFCGCSRTISMPGIR